MTVEGIAALLHEAAETHHTVDRIADEGWQTGYAANLVEWFGPPVSAAEPAPPAAQQPPGDRSSTPPLPAEG